MKKYDDIIKETMASNNKEIHKTLSAFLRKFNNISD
jgi:hypothetical protein